MEVRKMLDYYDVPDVNLADIVTQTLPQKRLLLLLISDGINNISDLRDMSDDDLTELKKFGEKKLEKLREFIVDWYENDFVYINHLNVTKPDTVMQSLQEEVFITYKNMSIVAMRGEYKTFDYIGSQFGQSRQSVQDKERYTLKKFLTWYDTYRLSEKIGNFDDFVLYCDTNFPEDQRVLKTAVKRLVTMAKRKE